MSKKINNILTDLSLKFIANDFVLAGNTETSWRLYHKDSMEVILNGKDNSIEELKKFAKSVCEVELSTILTRINLIIMTCSFILTVINIILINSSILRYILNGIQLATVFNDFIILLVINYNAKRTCKKCMIAAKLDKEI